MEPLIYCYCRTSSKTCNSRENPDFTAIAESPQKLAIALKPLIYCHCNASSKTCNSSGTIDITAIAELPQKLAIVGGILILLLLQNLLKNLQ